jgi:PadR family transcriptional regulator, regulatory protein AphA
VPDLPSAAVKTGDRTRLTATECGVLGLLSLGDASGYDLMKLAERSLGFLWQPVKSQLYALLPQLVERGYAARREVRQRGRPDKVVYSLTEHGREVLRTSLLALEPEGRAANAIFNFKIFFGDIVGVEHVRETIEARREEALARLEALRTVERGADPEEDFFPLLTLELGKDGHEAFVRWADRVLALLEEREAAAGKAGDSALRGQSPANK